MTGQPVLAAALPRPPRASVQEMAVVGSVAALVVALVAFARYPAPQVESVRGNSTAAAPAALASLEREPKQDAAYVSKAVSDVSKRILEKPLTPPRVTAKPAFAAPAPVPSSPGRPVADGEPSTPVLPSAPRASATAVPAPSVADARSELVAITGCLEMSVDEQQFRLTETDGAAAPKARSWRSGFLKKGSTPVDLVEVSDPLTLRQQVGQRVVATGLLKGHDLQLRSFHVAGSACD